MGIVIQGNMMFGGNAIFQPIWFYPNQSCCLKHSKYIVELPPPLASFLVANGTNPSLEEVKYLSNIGLIVSGVSYHTLVPSIPVLVPSPLEL